MQTKLLALAALAVGQVPGVLLDLQPGDAFEVDPAAAEPLLTNGQAKLAEEPLASTQPAAAPPPPPPESKTPKAVQARVLVECAHGQPNDLVELAPAAAKQAEKEGLVDTDKAAVAYAKSLKADKA